MKAFKLLALTSCVLLAAGNGVAQQNYSKSEGLLQYVDPYIGSRLSWTRLCWDECSVWNGTAGSYQYP